MGHYTINFAAEGVGPCKSLAGLTYHSEATFRLAPSREQVALEIGQKLTVLHGTRDLHHPTILVVGDLVLGTEHGRCVLVSAKMLTHGCMVDAKIAGFPDPALMTIEEMAQAVAGIQGTEGLGHVGLHRVFGGAGLRYTPGSAGTLWEAATWHPLA